jgi:hypothetical protein
MVVWERDRDRMDSSSFSLRSFSSQCRFLAVFTGGGPVGEEVFSGNVVMVMESGSEVAGLLNERLGLCAGGRLASLGLSRLRWLCRRRAGVLLIVNGSGKQQRRLTPS